MSANRFGQIFSITSFGESHGEALGVVIEGCPAEIPFDFEVLQNFLQRRRPGGKFVSARAELDEPQILSGVYEKKTLGTPIAILFKNQNQKSADYQDLKDRKGHADDVWRDAFGHVDPRGGGRSSGRETVARVAAAAIAKMFLKTVCPELVITAYPSQVGHLKNEKCIRGDGTFALTAEIENLLAASKEQGESYGAVVTVSLAGVPRGLGQPVFHKLKADLAFAMMSIGATVGFEMGEGFLASEKRGTEFHGNPGEMQYGGIRGGLTTGEEILLRIAFKPTSSILDVAKKGRHDPCIGIRGSVVCEAMAYLVIADHVLWKNQSRIEKSV